MTPEARELYVYTISKYELEIADCAEIGDLSVFINEIVAKAHQKYIVDYCIVNEDPFTSTDLKTVATQILKEMAE